MDKLDKLHRQVMIIKGVQDEAFAKIKFYRNLNRQKPHKREEIAIQVEKIRKDLAKYKKIRDKVELELEEIKNGFN